MLAAQVCLDHQDSLEHLVLKVRREKLVPKEELDLLVRQVLQVLLEKGGFLDYQEIQDLPVCEAREEKGEKMVLKEREELKDFLVLLVPLDLQAQLVLLENLDCLVPMVSLDPLEYPDELEIKDLLVLLEGKEDLAHPAYLDLQVHQDHLDQLENEESEVKLDPKEQKVLLDQEENQEHLELKV